MKPIEHFCPMSAGRSVQVDLDDGRVVIFYEQSNEHDGMGIVEFYDSIDALESGECSSGEVLVPYRNWSTRRTEFDAVCI